MEFCIFHSKITAIQSFFLKIVEFLHFFAPLKITIIIHLNL